MNLFDLHSHTHTIGLPFFLSLSLVSSWPIISSQQCTLYYLAYFWHILISKTFISIVFFLYSRIVVVLHSLYFAVLALGLFVCLSVYVFVNIAASIHILSMLNLIYFTR